MPFCNNAGEIGSNEALAKQRTKVAHEVYEKKDCKSIRGKGNCSKEQTAGLALHYII